MTSTFFFKFVNGILRNWESLCDIRPDCHHHFDASSAADTTHFSRFFRVIQSAACLITRPLHYLLSDLLLIEFPRDGGNMRGIYVATITIPKHEIGTTFASVSNKWFPLKKITSC